MNLPYYFSNKGPSNSFGQFQLAMHPAPEIPQFSYKIFEQIIGSEIWSVKPNRAFKGCPRHLTFALLNGDIDHSEYFSDKDFEKTLKPLQKALYRYAERAVLESKLPLSPKDLLSILVDVDGMVEPRTMYTYPDVFAERMGRALSTPEHRGAVLLEEAMRRSVSPVDLGNAVCSILGRVEADGRFWLLDTDESDRTPSRDMYESMADFNVQSLTTYLKLEAPLEILIWQNTFPQQTNRAYPPSLGMDMLHREELYNLVCMAVQEAGISCTSVTNSTFNEFLAAADAIPTITPEDSEEFIENYGVHPINEILLALARSYSTAERKVLPLHMVNALTIFTRLVESDPTLRIESGLWDGRDVRDVDFPPLHTITVAGKTYHPLCDEDFPELQEPSIRDSKGGSLLMIKSPLQSECVSIFDRVCGGSLTRYAQETDRLLQEASVEGRGKILTDRYQDLGRWVIRFNDVIQHYAAGEGGFKFPFSCDGCEIVFSEDLERISFLGFPAMLRFVSRLDEAVDRDFLTYFRKKYNIKGLDFFTPSEPFSPAQYLAYCFAGLTTRDPDITYRVNPETGHVHERCDYHLRTLSTLSPYDDDSRLPGDKVRDLEEIFHEIYKVQFQGRRDEVSLQVFLETKYSQPGSLETVSGRELLEEYVHLSRVAGNAPIPKALPQKLLEKEAEKIFDSLDEFHLSRKDEFHLFSAFDFNPVLIFKALTLLKRGSFIGASIEDFIVRYPGLDLPNAKEYYRGRYPQFEGDVFSPKKGIVDSMRHLFNGDLSYELNEETARLFSELLMHLYREEIEKSPTEALAMMEREQLALLGELQLGEEKKSASFVNDIFDITIERVQRIINFELPPLKEDPYVYQTEGICTLVNNNRFILADNTGLGKGFQMIGACEWLLRHGEVSKAIVATDPGYRRDLEAEILRFTHNDPEDVCVIDPDSLRLPREELKARMARARYLIFSYNTFVQLKPDGKGEEVNQENKEIYDLILHYGNSDAVVCADEAHYMDQPTSLRTQAMREFKNPKYLWLFTASLYQSDHRRLFHIFNFLDPNRFSDEGTFFERYTATPEALVRLQMLLSEFALCRLYEEVTEAIDPTLAIPIDEQLRTGLPKVPHPRKIDPKIKGEFEITWEQAQTYADIVKDFIGFAENFNRTAPAHLDRINLKGVNPFVKLHWLKTVLYEPQRLGLKPNPALTDLAVEISADHLNAHEKVLGWAENTSVLTTYVEDARLLQYGMARMDGEIKPNERYLVRERFNKSLFSDPDSINVMGMQFKAGGVSSSYKGASVSINLQTPQSHSERSQVDGRSRRVYGRHDAELLNMKYFTIH